MIMKSLTLALPLVALAACTSDAPEAGTEARAVLSEFVAPSGETFAYDGCRFEIKATGENVTPAVVAAVFGINQRSSGHINVDDALNHWQVASQGNGIVKVSGAGVGGSWSWNGFEDKFAQADFHAFLSDVNAADLLDELLHPEYVVTTTYEGYAFDEEVFSYSDECGFEVVGGMYTNETPVTRANLAGVFGASIKSNGSINYDGSLKSWQIKRQNNGIVKIGGWKVGGQFRWNNHQLDDGSALTAFLQDVNSDGLVQALLHN